LFTSPGRSKLIPRRRSLVQEHADTDAIPQLGEEGVDGQVDGGGRLKVGFSTSNLKLKIF
jgi:hypothetical protein